MPALRIRHGCAATAIGRRRLAAATALLAILGAGIALGVRVNPGATPTAPVLPPAKVVELYADRQMLMQILLPTEWAPDRIALRLALTARLTRPTAVARGNPRIRYVYDVEATARRVLGTGPSGGPVQAVRRAVSSPIMAPVACRRLQRCR